MSDNNKPTGNSNDARGGFAGDESSDDNVSMVSEKSISGFAQAEGVQKAAGKGDGGESGAQTATETQSEDQSAGTSDVAALNQSIESAESKGAENQVRAEDGGQDSKAVPDQKGPPPGKSQHLGDNLCEYELNLYEYSTFALMEEVDICYCKFKNTSKFATEFNDDDLRNEVQTMFEKLDQDIAPETKSQLIQWLYVFSMGEYSYSGSEKTKIKKQAANRQFNMCDGLQSLCVLFNQKVCEMRDVEHKGMHDQNLILELELRIVCNLLINFCIYNNDDVTMVQDFTNLDYLVEETCLLAIKLSLDTAFVPVRKIILILHVYLRYLFGEKKETPKHKQFYSNLKYLKEYIDYRTFEEVPRYRLNSSSKVEQFYKRNMNKNHPIPHIIVVGILRVLLSTCPNTKKNTTGGVHIHREWASCVKLYFLNKELFDEHGFKSELYGHEVLTKEWQKLREGKEASEKVDENSESDSSPSPDKASKQPEWTTKDEDFFDLEDYRYENDRHRVITAMIISDLFIYMLKHFKANCINQFVYLSQLFVDANGVLVLLKFLNQGFEKFKAEESKQLDQKCPFLQLNANHDLNSTIEETISQLLRLTYKLCRNQKERIKSFLIQYKGCLIMKKLINKFTRADLCKNAAKVIKIQIRHISKTWRKDNMKSISSVYQHVQLRHLDDWLGWKREKESGLTSLDRDQSIEEEKQWYTQEQIRQLNADFNHENYEQFYAKDDEEDEDAESHDEQSEASSKNKRGPGEQTDREKRQKKKATKAEEDDLGLKDIVNEQNLLYKMESQVQLPEHFTENYEQWLEDEVWNYFD